MQGHDTMYYIDFLRLYYATLHYGKHDSYTVKFETRYVMSIRTMSIIYSITLSQSYEHHKLQVPPQTLSHASQLRKDLHNKSFKALNLCFKLL